MQKAHLADPEKAWERVLKAAEIEDLRIHDLRRTLGSYQAATGANGYIIGKSLGHPSSFSKQSAANDASRPSCALFEARLLLRERRVWAGSGPSLRLM